MGRHFREYLVTKGVLSPEADWVQPSLVGLLARVIALMIIAAALISFGLFGGFLYQNPDGVHAVAGCLLMLLGLGVVAIAVLMCQLYRRHRGE